MVDLAKTRATIDAIIADMTQTARHPALAGVEKLHRPDKQEAIALVDKIATAVIVGPSDPNRTDIDRV